MRKAQVQREVSERRRQVLELQQVNAEQAAFIEQLLRGRDVLRYVGSLEEKLRRIVEAVDGGGFGLAKKIKAILADGTFDRVKVEAPALGEEE